MISRLVRVIELVLVAGDDFLVIGHYLNNPNRAIIKINIIAVTLRNALVGVKVGDFSVAD